MKNSNLIKLFALTIVFIFSVLNVSAKQSKNIVYDAEQKNGVLVGQTLYKCENNNLEKFARYNYVYDNDNRILENNISRWNKETNNWEKSISVQYRYENNTISTKYYAWNKDNNRYQIIPSMSNQIKRNL